jgi:hypothetical protein
MIELPNSFDVVYLGGRASDAVLVIFLQGKYIEVNLKGKSDYVDGLFGLLIGLEFEEEYRDIEMYFGGQFYTLTYQDWSALYEALLAHELVEELGVEINSRLH